MGRRGNKRQASALRASLAALREELGGGPLPVVHIEGGSRPRSAGMPYVSPSPQSSWRREPAPAPKPTPTPPVVRSFEPNGVSGAYHRLATSHPGDLGFVVLSGMGWDDRYMTLAFGTVSNRTMAEYVRTNYAGVQSGVVPTDKAGQVGWVLFDNNDHFPDSEPGKLAGNLALPDERVLRYDASFTTRYHNMSELVEDREALGLFFDHHMQHLRL